MVVFDDDYSCAICGERFDTKDEWKHHLKIVHTVPSLPQETQIPQTRAFPSLYGVNNMKTWSSPTETLFASLSNQTSQPHYTPRSYDSPMLRPAQPSHLITPPSSSGTASRTSVSPMAMPNTLSTAPQTQPPRPSAHYITPTPLSVQHYGVGPHGQAPQNVFVQSTYASPAPTSNHMSSIPPQNVSSQYAAPYGRAMTQSPQPHSMGAFHTNGAVRVSTPHAPYSPMLPFAPASITQQPFSWQNAAHQRAPVPISQQQQQLGAANPRVKGHPLGPAQQARSSPLPPPKALPNTPPKPSPRPSIGRSPKVPQSPRQDGNGSATTPASQSQFMELVYSSPRQPQNNQVDPRSSLTPTSQPSPEGTSSAQDLQATAKTIANRSSLPQAILDLGLTPDDFDPTKFTDILRCTPAKYKDIPPPTGIPDRLLFQGHPNTVLCFGNLLRLAVRYSNGELVDKANQDRPQALFDAPLISKRITQAVKWANKNWEWPGGVADARSWLDNERKSRGIDVPKQKRKRKDSVLETPVPSNGAQNAGSAGPSAEDAPPAKRLKQTPQASPRCNFTAPKPSTLLDGLREKALPNIQDSQGLQPKTPAPSACSPEQTNQHNATATYGNSNPSTRSNPSPAHQPPVVASNWRPANMASHTSKAAPAPVEPSIPPGYVLASDLDDTLPSAKAASTEEKNFPLSDVADLIDTIGEDGAVMLINAIGGFGRIEQAPSLPATSVPADVVDLTSPTPSPALPSGSADGNQEFVAAPPMATPQIIVSTPSAPTPQAETKKRKFSMIEPPTPTSQTEVEKHAAGAMPQAHTALPEAKRRRILTPSLPTPTSHAGTDPNAPVATLSPRNPYTMVRQNDMNAPSPALAPATQRSNAEHITPSAPSSAATPQTVGGQGENYDEIFTEFVFHPERFLGPTELYLGEVFAMHLRKWPAAGGFHFG